MASSSQAGPERIAGADKEAGPERTAKADKEAGPERTAVEYDRVTMENDGMRYPRGYIPCFDDRCRGRPRDWDKEPTWRAWGHKTKKAWWEEFKDREALEPVNIEKMVLFLQLRVSPFHEQPCTSLLGEPEEKDNGWFRLAWKSYDQTKLPDESFRKDSHGVADWRQAWHGCKMEALYSIIFKGRLLASDNAEEGHQFAPGAPGVYVVGDANITKAGSYSRYVQMFRDGVFWCAQWELAVDYHDRYKCDRDGQWAIKPESVHLKALWLHRLSYTELQGSTSVQSHWHPLKEANPCGCAWQNW